MGLANVQFRSIVAADPLHQLQRAWAADFDFAHVADVKQSGPRAHSLVLGEEFRNIPTAYPSRQN